MALSSLANGMELDGEREGTRHFANLGCIITQIPLQSILLSLVVVDITFQYLFLIRTF